VERQISVWVEDEIDLTLARLSEEFGANISQIINEALRQEFRIAEEPYLFLEGALLDSVIGPVKAKLSEQGVSLDRTDLSEGILQKGHRIGFKDSSGCFFEIINGKPKRLGNNYAEARAHIISEAQNQ
jgi:hypothetical protein